MSRSRRKTPIFGNTTATSEAEDKRLWHKRLRAKFRDRLKAGPDDPIPIDYREVSDPWCMSKDGRHYWKNATKKSLRK
jgi:hypothetical protein